jgi:hypothetical protein
MSILLALFAGFNVSIAPIEVEAQTNQKAIQLAYSMKPLVKFTEPHVGEEQQAFGRSFIANEEWIKEISFQVENTTEKPIVFLQINVNFPETRASGELMSYTKTFGQRPGSKLAAVPIRLMPKEYLSVSLAAEYDKMGRFLNSRHLITSINKVQLEVGFIVFEDKTAWTAGVFYRPDPDYPGKYIPIPNGSIGLKP